MYNNKIRGRKGFTLAELLIVVAIIAVLTAIAVPLFVGALSNANNAVKDANVRAVRSAAVSTILLNENKATYDYTKVDGAGTENATNWIVTAYVDETGAIHDMTIQADSKNATESGTCGDQLKENESAGKGKKGDYKVELNITSLKVTGMKAAS